LPTVNSDISVCSATVPLEMLFRRSVYYQFVCIARIRANLTNTAGKTLDVATRLRQSGTVRNHWSSNTSPRDVLAYQAERPGEHKRRTKSSPLWNGWYNSCFQSSSQQKPAYRGYIFDASWNYVPDHRIFIEYIVRSSLSRVNDRTYNASLVIGRLIGAI